ncbi:hypothetical protein BU24DRAFT_22475 [Aaosphaeria arxii CBS 175.79]|uniref:Uncharacterized protein n=1 Tax=Aaosphaeria arxii CBS 175.79 TaxID=1450172 RepID=A0A6A5Y898_9PLEO|nr:uncharacterized protein BU24DRAFT_22475 [Aaosphaeria arxii CBS 175.79]KAF2021549.1 hypothetical protein BU24DRAFT_22475 [Aaosphaeria arxii CBS 175.79]
MAGVSDWLVLLIRLRWLVSLGWSTAIITHHHHHITITIISITTLSSTVMLSTLVVPHRGVEYSVLSIPQTKETFLYGTQSNFSFIIIPLTTSLTT